jgi:hypothetical protein
MRTRIALAAAIAAALITIMTTTSLTLVSTAGSATTGPVTTGSATTAPAATGSATTGPVATGSTTSAKPATRVAGGGAGSGLSTAAELSMSNALHAVDEETPASVAASDAPTTTAPTTTPTTAAPATTAAPLTTPPRAPAATSASTAPVSTPATPPPVTDATSTATRDWQCIRVHESGDQYNSPAAPSGAYGILAVTWHSFGMSGWPYQAPASEQDAVALELYHRYGWAPWGTRFVCGL